MKIESEKIKKPVHFICLILLMTSLLLGLTTKAASIDQENDSLAKNNAKICELVSFTVRTVGGKNYINWNAKSVSDDYYFVLEKSFDGLNFSITKIKKCFVSPGGQNLQYSVIDEQIANAEIVYYRIALHKIEAIDAESKIISLSPKNTLEENAKRLIEAKQIVTQQKEIIVAKLLKIKAG